MITEQMYHLMAQTYLKEQTKIMFGDNYPFVPMEKVLKDLAASTGYDRDDLELPVKFIPFKNGMVELIKQNGRWVAGFIPNSPEHFVVDTQRVPHEYKPLVPDPTLVNPYLFASEIPSPDPLIVKIITENLADQPTAQLHLRQYMAYTLYRKYPYHYGLMWLGEGDNGKTTLLYAFNKCIGEQNTTQNSLQDICEDRWTPAELYLRYVDTFDDITDIDLKYPSHYKILTGESNRVRADLEIP